MKEITARTYKKLPEVQTKKEIVKKQQIEKANRLIKNIFNQVNPRLSCHFANNELFRFFF